MQIQLIKICINFALKMRGSLTTAVLEFARLYANEQFLENYFFESLI